MRTKGPASKWVSSLSSFIAVWYHPGSSTNLYQVMRKTPDALAPRMGAAEPRCGANNPTRRGAAAPDFLPMQELRSQIHHLQPANG